VAGRFAAFGAALLASLTLAATANAGNPQIAGLQVALRAYGLYNGPVDAIAGPKTVRATKAFQRRAGLVADGRAGPATRRALGPLGAPVFGRRTLRRGLFGWDVSVLQFMLARRGELVPVYGFFDRATSARCGATSASSAWRPTASPGRSPSPRSATAARACGRSALLPLRRRACARC
jgi:peptidoglycan hydrolase-like protein with peptidoglycan-binding domain